MDLLIKQVRLQDGEALQDVAIKEGKIIEIAPVITGDAKEIIEADGRVLIRFCRKPFTFGQGINC